MDTQKQVTVTIPAEVASRLTLAAYCQQAREEQNAIRLEELANNASSESRRALWHRRAVEARESARGFHYAADSMVTARLEAEPVELEEVAR